MLRTIYISVFQTALHLAVRQNNPGIVEKLLHFGALPSATIPEGDTCYHLAVRHGDGQSLGVILKHVPDRAEVNLLNDQGMYECFRLFSRLSLVIFGSFSIGHQ